MGFVQTVFIFFLSTGTFASYTPSIQYNSVIECQMKSQAMVEATLKADKDNVIKNVAFTCLTAGTPRDEYNSKKVKADKEWLVKKRKEKQKELKNKQQLLRNHRSKDSLQNK